MKTLALALTFVGLIWVFRRRPDHERVLRAVRECYTEGVLS